LAENSHFKLEENQPKKRKNPERDERQKAELELLVSDFSRPKKAEKDEKDQPKKKKPKKNTKKKIPDDFKVNLEDSRFAAVYENTEYAPDPTSKLYPFVIRCFDFEPNFFHFV
jgi:hypothetical protein